MYGLSQLPQLEEWQPQLTTGLHVAFALVTLQLLAEAGSRARRWAVGRVEVSGRLVFRLGGRAGQAPAAATDSTPAGAESASASARSAGP